MGNISELKTGLSKLTGIGSLAASCIVVASNAKTEIKAWATTLRNSGYPIWVCDGTDDQVEIQAAIDALPAGGGKIALSEGEYNLSDRVNNKDNVRITGVGAATYLHNTSAAGADRIAAERQCIRVEGTLHGSAKGRFLFGDLTADASAGQPDCAVTDASVFSIGDVIEIWDSANRETNTITNIVGNTVTMVNNLVNNYTVANSGQVRRGCSLTANGIWKELTITVADGSIFSAGDRVLISEALGTNLHKKTTTMVIYSVAGNVLTLTYALPYKFCAGAVATWEPNWLVANGAYVVIITMVNNVSIESLRMRSDNGYSMYAFITENFSIKDCLQETVDPYGQTIPVENSLYAKIIGNTCSGGGKLVLEASNHCTVISNTVLGTGLAEEFGIESYWGSNFNVISNNSVINNYQASMPIRGDSNIVTNNVVNRTVNAENLRLTGVRNIIIGNTLLKPSTVSITIVGFDNIITENKIESYSISANSENNRFFEKHSDLFMDVLAISATHVRSNEDLSAATPITFTIDAQPDVPRTLSGHFDTHAQITAYTIDITGVDAKGRTITETKTEDDGWDWETNNAFATITSIKMTARTGTGAGDTMDIGVTDVLGLSNVVYTTSDVYKIKKNNANAVVAAAQVNTTYDTYDMAVIGLAVGDDFTIWFKSNLNIVS